jgi:hypothetical protein
LLDGFDVERVVLLLALDEESEEHDEVALESRCPRMR